MLFGFRKMGIDIVAKHLDLPLGLGDQGADNANSGGFACTVGAEQGKKVTLLNIEVNTLQGLEAVAVFFVQVFDGQSGNSHSRQLTLSWRPVGAG